MKAHFAIFLIVLVFCSCVKTLDYQAPVGSPSEPISFTLDDFIIEGKTEYFSIEKELTELSDGVNIITFTFSADKPQELEPVTIKFNFPSVDVAGYWNPRITVDKINYWGSSFSSKASSNAPVLAYYNLAQQNRLTLAVSDALNLVEIRSYLKEEDVNFHPSVRLFREKMPKTTSYQVQLRIDTRSIPYYRAIDDVAGWWADKPDYKPMHVPDNAKKPMYSTWYSYHQNVSHEAIVAECKIAKSLGCEAVIVDDGWQTLDSNRGYAYVGDWVPERIPDMKGFVDAVHAEGMEFILWYSLPFMGENAKNYDRFKGKYLRYWESQGTYVMDPRYPEVREYIINTFETAINEWGLDGFKIDFIGRFSADENTVLTRENGRDFASVNDATDALMTELTNRLTAIKPDILIEFRQPYIGPLMRKYGNMFRGVDAPNNAIVNRVNVTNLRIMSQNTAVHSDMFIWRPEESVEQAALQILNILYSVPQLSVKLEEVPDEHLEMIRFWFGYWNEHRNVLLDGDFIPERPGSNYPLLTSKLNGHQITSVYEDIVVEVDNSISKLDIINAKSSDIISIRSSAPINGSMQILDCKGEVIFSGPVKARGSLNEFVVPPSGMIKFRK